LAKKDRGTTKKPKVIILKVKLKININGVTKELAGLLLTLAIHMQLEALNEGKLPQFCK
jgi:hypothetical protein